MNSNEKLYNFILDDIKYFCAKRLKGIDHYVIVYGSYAYGLANAGSDLDIMVACRSCDTGLYNEIEKFTTELHINLNMPLDNEIPYSKKLLIPYDVIASACSGSGIFYRNKWEIPKVIKTTSFLSDQTFLLRFYAGMMLSKHLFISGNYPLYMRHRLFAAINIIKAVLSINGKNLVSLDDIIKLICENKDASGELFLGFSYSDPHKLYLAEHVNKVITYMKCDIDVDGGSVVYNFDNDFLNTPSSFSEESIYDFFCE